MKHYCKFLLLLFVILIAFPALAQINVGPVEQVKMKTGTFEEEDLAALKRTTTIFVYRDADEENLDMWEEHLSAAWTCTEGLEFKSLSEFLEMESYQNYSFLTLGGFVSVNGNSVSTHIYLSLWMPGEKKHKTFSRIELYPDYPTAAEFTKKAYSKGNEAIKYLYADGVFRNWNLGMVKNALQEVNRNLKASKTKWLFESKVHRSLAPMAKDTLYIPDYCLIKFNKWNGDESERIEVEELMEKYPYPYAIVSAAYLEALILDSSQNIFYLTFVKASSDKFVNIVRSQTGEIWYSDYTPASYNIKDKDLEKLVKAMK